MTVGEITEVRRASVGTADLFMGIAIGNRPIGR